MRAIIRRIPLLETLRASRGIVKPATPKPVLKCVKLTAESDALTVEATDLELSFRRVLREVQIERAGPICVACEDLYAAVAAATDETLAVEVDGASLKIRTASGQFSLHTMDPKDFPSFQPADGKGDGGTIDADAFRRLIRRTSFALADENTRYAFAGGLFLFKGKKAVFVVSDGRRLVVDDAEATGKSPAAGWILPKRFMSAFDKTIGEGVVTIRAIGDGVLEVSDGETSLRTSLVEGSFPPWEDVVPKDDLFKVSTDRAGLLAAIAQVAPFSADDAGNRGLGLVTMSTSKEGIAFGVRSPQYGEASVKFPCRAEGGELTIGMGVDFLAEGVRAAEIEEITLHFTAPNRPMLIVGGSYRCVIMPRSLQ